jgi:uncharacterized protein YgfB (UPF0149 family)
MNQAVHYAELADALSRLGYSQDAAEYHGALCGALCVRAAREINLNDLLDATEPATDDAGARQALERLRDESMQSLEDVESRFELLLPDDEVDLDSRAGALASWCEGFLFGLSTAAGFDLKQTSPEVREIVADLVQFSHAASADGEDAEIEENAYAEIVEYVRVGAQLIFVELHPRASIQGGKSETLH